MYFLAGYSIPSHPARKAHHICSKMRERRETDETEGFVGQQRQVECKILISHVNKLENKLYLQGGSK